MNKLQADRADSCIDSMLVYSKSEVDDYITELEKEAIKAKNHMVELSKTITEQANTLRELEKENQLLKRVEQIFSDAPDLEFSRFEEMFPDEFEVHNLEQQISALTFALENITKPEDIYCRRKELRKQAAKLKG